ncbi:spheroidene monooxygenase [Sagittula sp. NFXS13]|uniref:spheroidene monooxygenase n=1 Tax=Sagittula sp. NFXS13 TaxID=2819095 RepID=UPI0032DEECBC
MQVVSLSFFHFPKGASRLWAFAMMGLARRGLRRTVGIGFWKLCGSGTGEGFTPVPNTGVYAILATWTDLDTARHQTDATPVFRAYHARSDESWTVFLTPTSVRGAWSGHIPFSAAPIVSAPESGAKSGPIAALTRATVRPARAIRFWQRVPDISAMIGQNPDALFKIGIGEVPLLHQITFSIWPDTSSMARFARESGPHASAIRAVRDGDWFREELYARFRILGDRGTWMGRSPLNAFGTTS